MKREIHKETREQFIKNALGDINPMKYSGEGFFNTEEYPRLADIEDPYTRGDALHEGEYYPRPDYPSVFRKRR